MTKMKPEQEQKTNLPYGESFDSDFLYFSLVFFAGFLIGVFVTTFAVYEFLVVAIIFPILIISFVIVMRLGQRVIDRREQKASNQSMKDIQQLIHDWGDCLEKMIEESLEEDNERDD